MKEYGTKVQVTEKKHDPKVVIRVLKDYMQNVMPYSQYVNCPIIIVRHPATSHDPYRCIYSTKSFTPESEEDALNGEPGNLLPDIECKIVWHNKPAKRIVAFWKNRKA